MKVLMISLDRNLLRDASISAQRMGKWAEYVEKLVVIVPAEDNRIVELNNKVKVLSVRASGKFLIKKISGFFKIFSSCAKQIRENKFDCITTQDPFFTGIIGYILAKKYKIGFNVQVHGDIFNPFWIGENWSNVYRNLMARFVLRRAGSVRVVSEKIKSDILELGIAEENIFVAPVFVDLKIFLSSKRTSVKIGARFVYLGRLEKGKNVETIIRAATILRKKTDNFILNIVGGGSLENRLKKIAEKCGVSDFVRFFSFTDEPQKFYSEADCFLFPSLHESFGVAPIEALSSGCFIISSKVGWINQNICQKSGIKCVENPLSAEEWAEKMLRFIENPISNPEAQKEIAKKIYPQKIDEIYSIQLESWKKVASKNV